MAKKIKSSKIKKEQTVQKVIININLNKDLFLKIFEIIGIIYLLGISNDKIFYILKLVSNSL